MSNSNTIGQCEVDLLMNQPIVTSRYSWRQCCSLPIPISQSCGSGLWDLETR